MSRLAVVALGCVTAVAIASQVADAGERIASQTTRTVTAAPPPTSVPGAGGCSAGNSFQPSPATTGDPLAPALLARYALLRREATPADQPPPVNTLYEQIGFDLGRYNPAYVRLLTQRPGGRRFFLVPGFPAPNTIPPARCLPAGLRRKRPALVAQELARERAPIACIATISPSAGTQRLHVYEYPTGSGFGSYGGGVCPPFADATNYESLSIGIETNEHAGILPDDIATVRVHFAHAPVVDAEVVQNFYLYKVAPAPRKKLLGRIARTLRRLSGRLRNGTKAQRERLIRRLAALSKHAFDELTATRIELLGADGHVIENVKRPKQTAAGLALGEFAPAPQTVPAPPVAVAP